MERKNSKNALHDIKPTIWIGKHGCSETIISEIIQQLEKRRIIKIKWLRNADVDPELIAELARARLVGVRGRTMVLKKE
jgi:RNA-binding protein